jgi:hypothetical protein
MNYEHAAREFEASQEAFREAEEQANKLLISSGDFIAGYVPADYAVYGIFQKRRLYGLTGKTGSGKTGIKLALAYRLGLGLPICGRDVEQCRVLYLAGENPDDVQARWIAMAEHCKFDPNTIPVHFTKGCFHISEMLERIRAEVDELGGVGAVMIDTAAAFFEFEDENDNVQAGRYCRMLRTITELAGGPMVLVGCHPTKAASEDSLWPRGGGAFLNELDGNVGATRTEAVVEVTVAGKFRGPDFEPLHFELEKVTAPQLVDSKGRPVWSVIARPITHTRQEAVTAAVRGDEDQVLLLLDITPGLSLKGIAERLNWLTDAFEPNKVKAQRTAEGLRKLRLVELGARGDGWQLTGKGKQIAKQLRERP